ncbi:FIVAR domain-containing protein [Gardnerella vaginalis]|uniref:FIVAR domain-containing protein n=1 Tax=Gardnerella vaginalis TaxID=2702 RepID=UPI000C7A0007|nr:FIVAR domain-containing protein [Gardnerella vaginalis]NSX29949.1 FIVAR domain-containing protein [Gardnerella vaginalis]PKZ47564.1 peptidase [Gardnerella vaginalis]
MVSKSRKHANTVKLDAVVSKAIEKAVYMRKVAALSAGAAGVIASAAIAFGATPAMAAEANPAPVKNTDTAKEQNLVDANKGNSKTSDDSKATKKNEASKDEDSKKTEPSESKKDQTDNKVAETQDNKSKIEPNLTSNKNASAQSVVKAEDKKQIENNAEQKKIAEQKTASTESVDNKTTTDKTSAADRTNATSRTTAENSAPAETTVKKSRSKRSIDENKQPETPASTVAQGEDRAGNEHNPDEVVFSKNLPNIYGWATPSNTFDTQLEKQKVVYHLPKSADGKPVVRVVILPDSKDSINTDDPEAYKKIIEFDSERKDEMHQSYSGIYELKTNTDGSVDLIMQQPFRDGGISSGQGYCANRSIFLYYDKTNLQHDQTSNNFRVATLVPPKTAGSIVLKYDERLSADKVREVLHKAVNLPTEHKAGSSVAEQLVAQSKSAGVGLRVDESTVNNTPDTVDAKIPKEMGSYDGDMFNEINAKDSNEDYSFGERKLKTYLVTDLGMKSPEIPLTVVRYSTRIEKPVVDTADFNALTPAQKEDIKKNLAKLNGVSSDKVTFDSNGTATIDFDGLSPQDDPKIPLSDLVLTRVATKNIAIPSDSDTSTVKAVVVANPLGYSQAELKQIKKAIYEANKDNQELGLSGTDYEKQISLGWIEGNLQNSGKNNQGISNGQSENTITVTIRTDKAYAQFKSDIKKHQLTRLIDLRKDYTLSWDADKNKINGRASDEGLAWMEDGKTLVYRYDPDKGEQINTQAVLDLLKATVKSDVKADNPQLRDNLLGTEITTVKREGLKGQTTRSHMSYTVDDKGEPIGVLNLVKLNGGGYGGFAKPVDNSDKKMGDEQSSVNKFTFDTESKAVEVAGKNGKCMIGRLFIEPYSLYYYNYVYGENKYNLRNTPKGINVVFVPQTKNKKDDLSKSIGEHKLADDQKTPTESKYYNASADKKDAYDKALAAAKETLEKVGTKADADLSEELKAEVDNATIKLDKAREALDGDATNKKELNKSIKANGKAAEGDTAATPGTVTTDKYKNVTEPDFKDDNGNADTTKNEDAKKAKEAYDKALEEANKVNKDGNATQKAVDDAKAKLDAARKELDKYSTNKDELNNAIAQHGKVYTGDADKQDEAKLKTADPTYQNSTPEQRKAYDDAVKKANELSADPNASQKEVNKAIDDLKKAKAALDAKATDKSQLITAEKLTFDNPDKDDATKQSTFYKNALNKQTNGANDQEKQAAKTAVDNYNNALAKAREVLKNDKATQKEVDEAKQKLEAAEKALHEGYKTDANDLTKAIADNFSGYLMPAYFNAFDKGKEGDTDAATAFKNYNDAYQKAKALKKKLEEAKTGKDAPDQEQINEAKTALEKAREVIDKYATDTSKISAALLNSLAITTSPAYQNASAGTEGSAAKKAKDAYDAALKKLHNAFDNKMDKDKGADSQPISEGITPGTDVDTTKPNCLDNIQQHAKGEPLDRDVTAILKELNDAAKKLDEFATKTDKLQESINKDTDTQKDPAYKNTKDPHKLGTDGKEDKSGYEDIKKKAKDYDDALADAKKLLTNPTATQAQVDAALKKLDEKRDALKAQDTNVEALKKSVDKNGKDASGTEQAVEGTKDSDAYRNASDPHFMKEQDGKLVPDTDKNKNAAAAKKAYDDALTKAQELLKRHDSADTPQDAKPTQKDINEALKALDEARTKLDTYKTNTDALSTEAEKSQADGATAPTTGQFEDSPEFKNADDKKGKDNKDNDDVAAYKKALEAARNLVKAATDTTKQPSERPTQQQVDEALDALKKAKKQIEDNYKTDTSKLEEAKKYANGDFKKTPEYKNAKAINDDQNANQDKKSNAKSAIDALDDTVTDSVLKKAKDIIENPAGKTQKEVDDALDALQKAMDKVTNGYKTDTDPLEKEVGDKTQDGKLVTPPFEESIPYKNALYKKQSETGTDATADTSATKKLQDYNDKFEAAKKIIDQVKNPDPNAEVDKQPTNADVKKALDDLQQAKKAIDDAFTTNAKDLKDESAKSTADGATTVGKDDFENTTEYKNADSKKGKDGKDNADIAAYKEALKNARTLLGKFDESGKPNSGEKDVPTQKEVDEALQKLKEIKDKIIADYKTSSTELQQEFDKSKDGDNDKRDEVFENTPAFKNAQAKGDEDSKKALEEYNEKLKAAKKLLDAFDRTTGKPKTKLPEGMDKAPTQKELYDALDALQAAKKKITEGYKTDKTDLTAEAGKDSDFTQSPEYQNAAGSPEAEAYKRALDEANAVLKNPNATQAEVDEALKKLQDAKQKLTDSHKTDKSDLNTEADNDPDFRKSIPFIIGKAADLAEYQQALNDANSVLKDPNATQAQVDQALRRLRDAKQKLIDAYNRLINSGSGVGDNTGVGVNDSNNTSVNNVVDKGALQAEVDAALGDVSANASGVVADSNLVSEFNAALNHARLVLADANVTQGQVDSALARLRAARAALREGMLAARDSAGMNLKRGDVSGVNTGASSSVFAALAAVFAGLGVAGAASKRRKHSAR